MEQEPLTPEEVLVEAPVEDAEPTENPDTHRFECRSCGYVYDPAEGVKKVGIEAGTPLSLIHI